ncbi:MAG: type II toxin-antitoxin system VapC family toxin [Armatimonadota bacterium]|nr:type II toxin-antitoxin system VapC family toxin [Armatimonadota bacterium]
MRLTEIPRPGPVFVDANIFIYHFAGQSEECTAFLSRVESGDLQASTGQTILQEVAHRLMLLEALERGLQPARNPAAHLARRPALVKRLFKYHFSTMKIPQMGVGTLVLPGDFLAKSQEYRQVYGLLVNDSLIPLYMQAGDITLLASADSAFDRVPWIRRAAPGDV